MIGSNLEVSDLQKANLDLPLPFTLSLDNAEDGDGLHCINLERLLRGKRVVCRAQWRDREVFAKIFIDPRHAQRDWQQERRGIEALVSRNILTPELLYAGQTQDNMAYVLITAAVMPALTFKQAFEQADNDVARLELLKGILHVFAMHHNAGIVHHDPHFNNFLVSEKRIYTLDASDIVVSAPPLTKKEALKNLAAFFSIFKSGYELFADLVQVFDAYLSECKGGIKRDDLPNLLKKITQVQQKNNREYLSNKIFRECTAFSNQHNFSHFIIYGREYESPCLKDLVDNLDHYVDNKATGYLKQGNASTIAIVECDDKALVIKRYNNKSLWHRAKNSFRQSRAARSWRNAHRLLINGIATAKPVALIERRFGPLKLASYFVTEHVDAIPSNTFFFSDQISSKEKIEVAHKMVQLLVLLRKLRIAHGDMKATNILIHGNVPLLMDLDSMHEVRVVWRRKRELAKDVSRFLRNWAEDSNLRGMFASELENNDIKIIN